MPIGRGIFLVPEDRKRTGLLLDFSIAENISLADLPALRARDLVSAPTSENGPPRRSGAARHQGADVDDAHAVTLSGGNQQKVVLAKWLAMTPKVIIFDEPTRGIDVGAKDEIYRLMRALADAGVADPDDLQRHGGGHRRQRPHRGDA